MTEAQVEKLLAEYVRIVNSGRRYFIENTDYMTEEEYRKQCARKQEIISLLATE